MHTTVKVVAQDMSHSSAEGKKLNMMKKEPERSNAVKVERSPMERRIVWNPQREVEPTLESLLAQMNDARVPTQAYGGIDDSRGVVGNTDGSSYGGVGGGAGGGVGGDGVGAGGDVARGAVGGADGGAAGGTNRGAGGDADGGSVVSSNQLPTKRTRADLTPSQREQARAKDRNRRMNMTED